MRIFLKFQTLFLAIGLMAFSSCNNEDQSAIDEEIIKDYLLEHNIDASRDNSGIYYLITKEGNGISPDVNSTVEVKYKGYLTNGSVFDETGSSSATFALFRLITGWQIGIPLLSEGGKGTFFIPSELGYGSRATGSIPANSVLIFEIELIDIK